MQLLDIKLFFIYIYVIKVKPVQGKIKSLATSNLTPLEQDSRFYPISYSGIAIFSFPK